MLPSLADIAALEARVGTIDPSDNARAQAALDDASAIVREEAQQTWTDDTGNLTTVPGVVGTITLAVARRIFDNPDGYQSETVGDWTGRYSDGMYLTDDERRILGRYRPTGAPGGLWAIQVDRPDITARAVEYRPETTAGADPIAMFDKTELGYL